MHYKKSETDAHTDALTDGLTDNGITQGHLTVM